MKRLLMESFFYLGIGKYLKSIPFSKVAPTLGKHMEETTFDPPVVNKKVLPKISQAIQIMSRYTFWESQCLVKAIAAMKMLEKRQIESTLYLGTARDQNGELIAHAWLRSGPYYITGFEEMHKFTVVGKFAKKLGGNNDD
ncbi:stage V sporulation protein S [Bacillus sp. SA1-12]|uniref:lasso peptide biosynthesis B2 protein n=1 Tax=Bacillus sp. SA1-12 TaxID=1455638 RepID=UPI000626C4CD|nr:lasso peptide biosynthesis B2 protein [Bacillus sp. SA1-12]KKI91464.1 stage V sporulation protein S [Bacillus sp. SA1-12]